MVDLVTALKQAHRESPSWRLYGLCHQAATRIAKLEAEIERTKKWYLDAIEQRDKYARLWDESLSRTGAVKVDELAQEIRRVDGGNSLGAGALAEALMPFLSTLEPAARETSTVASHETANVRDKPEGQQEAVAWFIEWRFKPSSPDVKRPGSGSKVLWGDASTEAAATEVSRLRGIETVDWVRCSPLYTRPAEQAVTEAMVDMALSAFKQEREYPVDGSHDDWTRIDLKAALKAAMEAGR